MWESPVSAVGQTPYVQNLAVYIKRTLRDIDKIEASCRERAILDFQCSPVLGAWRAAGYEDACAYAMLVVEGLYNAHSLEGHLTGASKADQTRLRCLGLAAHATIAGGGQAEHNRQLCITNNQTCTALNTREEALSPGSAKLSVSQQGVTTAAPEGRAHSELPGWQVMAAAAWILPALVAVMTQRRLLCKPKLAGALLPDVQEVGTSGTSGTVDPCQPAVSHSEEAGLEKTQSSGNLEGTGRRGWVGTDVVVRGCINPQAGLMALEEHPGQTVTTLPATPDAINKPCLEELPCPCPPLHLLHLLPDRQSFGNPQGRPLLAAVRKSVGQQRGRDKGVQTREIRPLTQELGPANLGYRARHSSHARTRVPKESVGTRGQKQAAVRECSPEKQVGGAEILDVKSNAAVTRDAAVTASQVALAPEMDQLVATTLETIQATCGPLPNLKAPMPASGVPFCQEVAGLSSELAQLRDAANLLPRKKHVLQNRPLTDTSVSDELDKDQTWENKEALRGALQQDVEAHITRAQQVVEARINRAEQPKPGSLSKPENLQAPQREALQPRKRARGTAILPPTPHHEHSMEPPSRGRLPSQGSPPPKRRHMPQIAFGTRINPVEKRRMPPSAPHDVTGKADDAPRQTSASNRGKAFGTQTAGGTARPSKGPDMLTIPSKAASPPPPNTAATPSNTQSAPPHPAPTPLGVTDILQLVDAVLSDTKPSSPDLQGVRVHSPPPGKGPPEASPSAHPQRDPLSEISPNKHAHCASPLRRHDADTAADAPLAGKCCSPPILTSSPMGGRSRARASITPDVSTRQNCEPVHPGRACSATSPGLRTSGQHDTADPRTCSTECAHAERSSGNEGSALEKAEEGMQPLSACNITAGRHSPPNLSRLTWGEETLDGEQQNPSKPLDSLFQNTVGQAAGFFSQDHDHGQVQISSGQPSQDVEHNSPNKMHRDNKVTEDVAIECTADIPTLASLPQLLQGAGFAGAAEKVLANLMLHLLSGITTAQVQASSNAQLSHTAIPTQSPRQPSPNPEPPCENPHLHVGDTPSAQTETHAFPGPTAHPHSPLPIQQEPSSAMDHQDKAHVSSPVAYDGAPPPHTATCAPALANHEERFPRQAVWQAEDIPPLAYSPSLGHLRTLLGPAHALLPPQNWPSVPTADIPATFHPAAIPPCDHRASPTAESCIPQVRDAATGMPLDQATQTAPQELSPELPVAKTPVGNVEEGPGAFPNRLEQCQRPQETSGGESETFTEDAGGTDAQGMPALAVNSSVEDAERIECSDVCCPEALGHNAQRETVREQIMAACPLWLDEVEVLSAPSQAVAERTSLDHANLVEIVRTALGFAPPSPEQQIVPATLGPGHNIPPQLPHSASTPRGGSSYSAQDAAAAGPTASRPLDTHFANHTGHGHADQQLQSIAPGDRGLHSAPCTMASKVGLEKQDSRAGDAAPKHVGGNVPHSSRFRGMRLTLARLRSRRPHVPRRPVFQQSCPPSGPLLAQALVAKAPTLVRGDTNPGDTRMPQDTRPPHMRLEPVLRPWAPHARSSHDAPHDGGVDDVTPHGQDLTQGHAYLYLPVLPQGSLLAFPPQPQPHLPLIDAGVQTLTPRLAEEEPRKTTASTRLGHSTVEPLEVSAEARVAAPPKANATGWDGEIAARALAQPDAQASSPTAALLAIWAETALEHPLLFVNQLRGSETYPALPTGRLQPPETLSVPGPADCTISEGSVVKVAHSPTASLDKSPPRALGKSSMDASSLQTDALHGNSTGPTQQLHPAQGGQLAAGQVATLVVDCQTEAVEAAHERSACQKEDLEGGSRECRLPFGDLTNQDYVRGSENTAWSSLLASVQGTSRDSTTTTTKPSSPTSASILASPAVRRANKAARYAALRKRLVRQHGLNDPLLRSTTSASTSASITPWSTPSRNTTMNPMGPQSAYPTDTETSGSMAYTRDSPHASPPLSLPTGSLTTIQSPWGSRNVMSDCETSPSTSGGSEQTHPHAQRPGSVSERPTSMTTSPASTAGVRRDSNSENASQYSTSITNSTFSRVREGACHMGFTPATQDSLTPSLGSLPRGAGSRLWYESKPLRALGDLLHQRGPQDAAWTQAFQPSPPWSASPDRSSRTGSRAGTASAKRWSEAHSLPSSDGSVRDSGRPYPSTEGGVRLHLLSSARRFV